MKIRDLHGFKSHLYWFCLIMMAMSACTSSTDFPSSIAERLPKQIDFNFHIKPILSDRCYSCHGPDEKARKAGLRLDTEEGAFAALEEGKGRYALVPGNVRKSELHQRIYSSDPDYKMPPPESKLSLSLLEKATIRRWIAQGARWKRHWAFEAPQKKSLPDVKNTHWPQNPIDHFILSKIEQAGLSPTGKADKATLLRRLSFDLIGLPPSLNELDAFLADSSSNAYEKQIDRLLSSPAYGERMAADWMDVARYADTHGYLDDMHREVWHWRDWVIQAFNQNLPYDDFIKWQTAGDLIPNASFEQKLATGFQRLHRQNQEGGVLPEEYRVEYVADRVQTTAKAFLGITLECARCHDHKYDPISQKEFYQMAAFFNNTFETGRAPIGYESGPTLLLTDRKTDAEIAAIRQSIAQQRQKVDQYIQEQQNTFAHWEETDRKKLKADNLIRKGLLAHYSFDKSTSEGIQNDEVPHKIAKIINGTVAESLTEGKKGKALQFDDQNAMIAGREIGRFERTDPFSVSLWVYPAEQYADATIFDNCDHKWHAYRGYELRIKEGKLLFRIAHNYPQNALQIESINTLPANVWSHIVVSYNGSSKAEGMRIYLDGESIESQIVHNHLSKSILHDDLNPGVVMPYFGFKLGWRLNDPTLLNGKIDELSIYSRALTELEANHLSGNNRLDSALTAQKPTPTQKVLLQELYAHQVIAAANPHIQELRRLQNQENELLTPIPEVMVLGDQPTLRPTFVLNRGNYQEPGEEVFIGTPGSILAYDSGAPKNRLGLAQWLIDPRNPLTTRVAVNRLWQICFGEGLVRTPDDFGSQGALPTHPDLLDYLAMEFRESGWDLKAMLKQIMMSATYQQASYIRPELQEVDPKNEMLAYAPRYRLSAEMLRDQALASSGLLVRKAGGKSIKPYQPEGLWAELAFQKWAVYEQDKGMDLYKRTLYIYWKRNTPHPFMTTFDIPDRATCSVKRLRTSTPLQALMMMNYPQFPEAGRALAVRILKEGGTQLDSRLRFAWRVLTSHYPTETELALMRELYQKQWERFNLEPTKALEFLKVGQYEAPETLSPIELASFAAVSLALMNTTKSYIKP